MQGGSFRNRKIGRFLAKPDTQLRVSPCFGLRTQPACPFPNSRIFRCEGISFIPALNKDQRSHGFRPKNTRIISLPSAPRQLPRSPELALGVRHAVPKRKFRTDCKSGAKSLHSVHLLRANIRAVIAKSAKISSSLGSPTSESESPGCYRTGLPTTSATGFAGLCASSNIDKSKAPQTFGHCRFPPAHATPNPSEGSWNGCQYLERR